jgi:adenylate cyclase
MTEKPIILVVDDEEMNIRLVEAQLTSEEFEVRSAGSGEEALKRIAERPPDLILLDLRMPGMDGFEVCRRLRADPATAYLPVIMITASGNEQKLEAIEAGVDDFLPKPYDAAELKARVGSLLRIKTYHDTTERQAAELAAWNTELEARVESQVDELERVGRLRRFLSPQLADMVVASGDDSLLETHRREITAVFCDLRGFTAFAERSEPEEVIDVLNEYHSALGDLVSRFEGTLQGFTGDGLVIFFNDPVPCPDPSQRAVQMAVAMRNRIQTLAEGWARRGRDLSFGVGIAQGFATLGRIGFEGRFDYAAIGSVMNLAARLCAEAKAWQVLVSQRVKAECEDIMVSESLGDLELRGFADPVHVHNVRGLNAAVTS